MKYLIPLILFFGYLAFAQVDALPTQSSHSSYLTDSIGNAYTSSASGTVRALDVRDRFLNDAVVSGTTATVTAINNLNASNTAITSAGTTAIVNEIKSASASNTTIVTSATTSLINNSNSGSNKTQLVTSSNNNFDMNHGVATSSTLRTVAVAQDAAGDLPDAGTAAGDNGDANTIGWFGQSRGYLFDGTAWDRMRSTDIGNNVTGLGIAASGLYGQYNATSPTAIDTRYGVLQTDINYNLKANIVTKNNTSFDTGTGAATSNTLRVATSTDPVNDYVNTQFISLRKTIGTTQELASVGATNLTNRRILTIYNDSTTILYYGPSGVTTSGTTKGEPLFPNQQVSIPVGDGISVYIIASVAAQSAIIKEYR